MVKTSSQSTSRAFAYRRTRRERRGARARRTCSVLRPVPGGLTRRDAAISAWNFAELLTLKLSTSAGVEIGIRAAIGRPRRVTTSVARLLARAYSASGAVASAMSMVLIYNPGPVPLRACLNAGTPRRGRVTDEAARAARPR